ncbi:unnamed protein product [marine sediment metagenome]|uniref:Uncharacterized protein n=1 Tax=marine sediment metagenome TaxID=412755 RepID=X0XCA3_9ZZZZ
MENEKEVMNMTTLTLELPKDLLSLLQERASKGGQEPQEAALRILRKELAPEAKSEREQVIEALRASGLVRPLSEDLRQMIDPDIDYEAVRRELAERSFDPPLSQIILENRGEK